MLSEEDYMKIKIKDFDYVLPEDRIARYPLYERTQSKLLVYKEGEISEKSFINLPDLIPSGSFLVFNNTRVIHARLLFKKDAGSRIEIFCLRPHEPADYQLAFQIRETSVWECIIGNSKRWKNGSLILNININGCSVFLSAERIGHVNDHFLIRFSWDKRFSFGEIIENAGVIPIPPYLNRETENDDAIRYQTVYAKENGSVAAPTAGLHFTESVLYNLRKKYIKSGELTLHVGAGTFLPVKSASIGGHIMHGEYVSISRELIENILLYSGKIIAVGTTSLRSLESLYWLGVRLKTIPFLKMPMEIGQWEPYTNSSEITFTDSLKTILEFLDNNCALAVHFSTRLIIIPGYRFKIVSGLITNFHQPQSTLLLLVAAFIGPDWKKVYQYALDQDFRFLSYGDSNFYLP